MNKEASKQGLYQRCSWLRWSLHAEKHGIAHQALATEQRERDDAAPALLLYTYVYICGYVRSVLLLKSYTVNI
jgi:hypothetical protein